MTIQYLVPKPQWDSSAAGPAECFQIKCNNSLQDCKNVGGDKAFWWSRYLGSLRNWRKYDEAWLWKSDCIGRLEKGVKLATLYVEGPLILATLIYSVAQQPTRPFFLHFFFCWWSKTLHHYHHLCVSSQWCMTHWRDWRAFTVMDFVHFLSGALPPWASFYILI